MLILNVQAYDRVIIHGASWKSSHYSSCEKITCAKSKYYFFFREGKHQKMKVVHHKKKKLSPISLDVITRGGDIQLAPEVLWYCGYSGAWHTAAVHHSAPWHLPSLSHPHPPPPGAPTTQNKDKHSALSARATDTLAQKLARSSSENCGIFAWWLQRGTWSYRMDIIMCTYTYDLTHNKTD